LAMKVEVGDRPGDAAAPLIALKKLGVSRHFSDRSPGSQLNSAMELQFVPLRPSPARRHF
jgi:hypothetical protein